MKASRGRWAWAAISTLGYVATGFAALVVISTLEGLGLLAFAEPKVHGVGLALQVALWGVLAALIVVASARLLLGAALRAGAGAISLVGAGLVVAALTQYVLYDWVMAKFGYYVPEYIGWTIGLPAAIVAVSVAGFSVIAVPDRSTVLPPLIALATAAAGVGFIVASNVGGLTDGIRPASVPLAIMVGAAGAFTVTVAGTAFTRSRSAGPRV
jgi:hypothetical protein